MFILLKQNIAVILITFIVSVFFFSIFNDIMLCNIEHKFSYTQKR